MLNFWQCKILRDEKKEGEGTAPPAPPAPPAADPGNGQVPTAKDLGYEEDPPAPPAPPAPPEPPKDEKIEDPVTGYGKDIPEPKDDPPAPPAADPKDAEIEKHLGEGLPKEEVEKIKSFAKTNEMTEKQIKAYGDLRRQEIQAEQERQSNLDKEHEKERQRIFRGWQEELRKDPAFGGENFESNVTLVEKLVHNHLPEYKKRLTEAGGMMPPYLMRDLAKLAKAVYKTEPLVHGDPVLPPAEPKDDGKKNDPLSFYE